ncbi:MAG TPA: hypothetical protein VND96_19305 [Candidatus Micrarchaeaceae archaeon]|nr:hypothetical protein [Candidatus Micrarchaeaceae archaeon]
MSRTTTWVLPRSVTRARHRLVGGGHGLKLGAWLSLGVANADGETDEDGMAEAVGVEPQADAMSAVTASARIQSAVFMSLQR